MADEFVDRLRHQPAVVPQPVHQLRVGQEHVHHVGAVVADGVRAADDDGGGQRDGLVLFDLPGLPRLGEYAREVVGPLGGAAEPAAQQLHDVRGDFGLRGHAGLRADARVQDLVGPHGELVPLLARDTEQVGDDGEGQRAVEVRHEVGRGPLLLHGVQQFVGRLLRHGTQPLHMAARECLVDDLAELGVVRRVGVVERRGAGHAVTGDGRHLDVPQRFPAEAGVGGDRLDVLVAGHQPRVHVPGERQPDARHRLVAQQRGHHRVEFEGR
nr:hypothetical protein [Streptomyces avermitilis]